MHCDLHTHSTASDGTDSPGDLPRIARAVGVGVIALTDHDTTAGLAECAAACEREGVAFVPGIEISADPAPVKRGGGFVPDDIAGTGTLHILGLFINPGDAGLLAIHHRLQAARLERNPQIVHNLRSLGIAIEYEEVIALANASGTNVIGRPHIAQVLVNKGHVSSVSEAFAKYIGEGKPAFARRDRLPPHEAINAIHRAGGLAILAHPIQLKYASDPHLRHTIANLRDLGLDGVETQHHDHSPWHVERYEAIARDLGLLTSGGSDYHGTRKVNRLGEQRVAGVVADRLRERTR